MNNKDIIKLSIFNVTLVLLILEYLCLHIDVAFPVMVVWAIITLVVDIFTIKNYAVTVVYEEVYKND